MVRNSLVLWFFCQPLRPLRKRWQLSTLDVRVSCVFWVSGQKSHHQNNEDVHGQVCHCEFHFTFTGESCGLMGKWKEKGKSQWKGFHCVLLWISQSFNSKYFMHLSSYTMAVQENCHDANCQFRRWSCELKCHTAQNIWQLQQNSWSQPEQNWLVCFSPQHTHTLEVVYFSIQIWHGQTTAWGPYAAH